MHMEMYVCIGSTHMYVLEDHWWSYMHLSFNFLFFFYYLLTPDPASWKLWSLPTFCFLTCSSPVFFNHHCPYSHPLSWRIRIPCGSPDTQVHLLHLPVLKSLHLLPPALASEGYYQMNGKHHKLLSPLRKKISNSGVSFVENRMPADNFGSKKYYARLLFKQCGYPLATKDNPGFFSLALFLAGI